MLGSYRRTASEKSADIAGKYYWVASIDRVSEWSRHFWGNIGPVSYFFRALLLMRPGKVKRDEQFLKRDMQRANF